MADREEVKKLAALARIEVEDAKLDAFASEFDAILAYVGKLDSLSLSIEAPKAGLVKNVMRPDENPHEKGAYTEALVEQFPEKEGNLLSVKQILSHE